ncbi:hypothetical protein RD110_01810 [Rhodoferax koreense]|uniref:DUF4148 domain-containing protein n=1 Tax=Rhodoferax koreensis TaxID=1842727 RepID=A0A1P8JQT8_9BURK|nr:DUF4148 domain-containing protein [Rhodoferax koreense]APW36095.1 hypothetical protein RD110_01810 [Rhodoferax koreense]
MNTTKILSSALIAVAALSAASAFAGDNNSYPELPVQASTLTRAQVRAEVAQAQRDGTLQINNDDYPAQASALTSVKTRDQVKAELRDAQRAGYTQRIDNAYPGDVAQGGNANVRG